MTTNPKWTTTAGPRQTKPVSQALNNLQLEHKHFVELNGTIGKPETESRWGYMSLFSNDVRPDVEKVWQTIGQKYNWTITPDNRAQIIADVEAALPELQKNRPIKDKRITPEESAARTQAVQDNQEKDRQDKIAIEAACAKIRAEKPWADFSDTKSSHARAAANLKRELELTFPGTKFSVKSDSYSGGDSINVSWEFGPTATEVTKISSQYENGHFDGMTDSYETDRSIEGRAHRQVLGGVDYIHENRSYTGNPNLFDTLGRMLCNLQGVKYEGSDIKLFGENDTYTLHEHIYKLLSKTSFPPGAEISGVEFAEGQDHWCKIIFSAAALRVQPTVSATGATFSVNSEKGGLEIRFPAKPEAAVIDSLKANGWRWSRFSSCWWAKDTAKARAFAAVILGTTSPETKPAVQPKPVQVEPVTTAQPVPPARAGIQRFNPALAIAEAVTVNASNTGTPEEPTAPPPVSATVVPVEFATASTETIPVRSEPIAAQTEPVAAAPVAPPAMPAWKRRLMQRA